MRWLILLLLQAAVLLLAGQNEQRIDSLEAELKHLSPYDTAYSLALVDLWRATNYSDTDRAAAYARRMIRDGREYNNALLEATGFQRLGISQSMLERTDSALLNYRRALDMYRASENRGLEGVMLYNIGALHYDQGRLDSARAYLDRASERFAGMANPQRTGAVYSMLGQLEHRRGRFDEALRLILTALDYFKEAGDEAWLAETESHIGLTYRELERYGEAFEHLERAERTFLRIDDHMYATGASVDAAVVLMLQGDYGAARSRLQAAVDTARARDFVRIHREAVAALAELEHRAGNWQRASSLYADLLPMYENQESPVSEADALTDYARLLLKLDRAPAALVPARRAVKLAREAGTPAYTADALDALSRAYAAVGNHREALSLARERENIRDSTYRVEVAARLGELQTRYETERRERTIAEQQLKLSEMDRERSQDRLEKALLLLGVVSLLGVLAAIVYFSRRRRQRNEARQRVLRERVKYQQRELSTHALQLARKNQFIAELGDRLQAADGTAADNHALRSVLHRLREEELETQDWENFENYFREVHGSYESRLQKVATARLSRRELRLAALIKMGLANQEMSGMLNVSQETLYKAKYRLRKKLPAEDYDSLDEYLIQF